MSEIIYPKHNLIYLFLFTTGPPKEAPDSSSKLAVKESVELRYQLLNELSR
jgi:hypothetical protein